MAPPSDDAIKTRIITHMNADHRDSVMRYAVYYADVSRFFSRSALMTDISLDSLTISTGGGTHVVPIEPPMKSLSEARERVIDMDKKAVAGLKRSPITLKEYKAPRGFHAVVFAACFGTYLLLSRRENVLPGSLSYDILFKHVPPFAAFAYKVRDLVLWPMIVLHLTEAYFMTKTLEKHSVPIFSRLWWTWVVSCFIEGYGSFQRIAAIVEEKKQKQNKH